MGLLKALDKLANAGARSVMPAEKLARARDQALTTNVRNELAETAAGYSGASRSAQRAADAQLVAAVGKTEADRLKQQAVHRVRNSFSSGRR